MTLLDAAAQHPLISTAALICLVYLTCFGGVLAVQVAMRGRVAYWLVVVGAFFFLVGAVWGRGYLSGGTTFAFVAGGIVAAVFGVALDLIVGAAPRSE